MCLPECCSSLLLQLTITILSILSSIALVSSAENWFEDWFNISFSDTVTGWYVIITSLISLYLSIRKFYKLQRKHGSHSKGDLGGQKQVILTLIDTSFDFLAGLSLLVGSADLSEYSLLLSICTFLGVSEEVVELIIEIILEKFGELNFYLLATFTLLEYIGAAAEVVFAFILYWTAAETGMIIVASIIFGFIGFCLCCCFCIIFPYEVREIHEKEQAKKEKNKIEVEIQDVNNYHQSNIVQFD